MKKQILFVILMGVVTVSMAKEFRLQHDATGQTLGPFPMKNGAQIAIGKTTFTVLIDGISPFIPMEGVLADQLKATTLPSAVYMNASPLDCISHIREVLNTTAKPDAQINIVTRNVQEDAPFSMDPFDMDFDKMDRSSKELKTVTLTLKDVSALYVLEEICKQGELHMREENGMVVIEPRE